MIWRRKKKPSRRLSLFFSLITFYSMFFQPNTEKPTFYQNKQTKTKQTPNQPNQPSDDIWYVLLALRFTSGSYSRILDDVSTITRNQLKDCIILGRNNKISSWTEQGGKLEADGHLSITEAPLLYVFSPAVSSSSFWVLAPHSALCSFSVLPSC